MENRLWQLFDYQKFAQNPALQGVIGAVHSRYAAKELSLDDVQTVNAAGAPFARQADINTDF